MERERGGMFMQLVLVCVFVAYAGHRSAAVVALHAVVGAWRAQRLV